MSARNDEYYLLCITDDSSKIVGTGALLVERKFIHNLGLVGHIEDIAVAKDQQGKKLGLRIIQALDFVAEKVGCYKVCPDTFMSFRRNKLMCTALLLTCVIDYPRLLRGQRGVLRQVRVQESGIRDGALLRTKQAERRSVGGCLCIALRSDGL